MADSTEPPVPDRIVTVEELRMHDGLKLPPWVAVGGVVYDVSKSFQWIHGKHQELHWSGLEQGTHMKDAPHGMEVFDKFPKIGRLKQ